MKGHAGHNHQTHTYKAFRVPREIARKFRSGTTTVLKRQQHKRSRAWGKALSASEVRGAPGRYLDEID